MSQDGSENRSQPQATAAKPKMSNSKTAGLTAWDTPVRLGDLSNSRTHHFELTPSTAQAHGLRDELDLISLRKMRFTGTLSPVSKHDWHLEGTLGATVAQPCVTTLEPVTTRIDGPVIRLYMSNYKDPTSAAIDDEIEIPEDDTVEALPTAITLSDIAAEALSMALPDYPRAAGASLETAQFTQAGEAPMTDEDVKPFASLKSLRDKLEKGH